MRGIVIGRLQFRSGLAAALAIAMAGSGAASAQAAWQPNRKSCHTSDISMPAIGALSQMLSECDAASRDADRNKAAAAAYNAARAYNERGETRSDPASSESLQDYAFAIERITTSFVLVPNDDPRLAGETNRAKRLVNDRFRLGRAYEKGRALVDIGMAPQPLPPGSPPSTRACTVSSRENCFSEAITWLNQNESLATPFAGPQSDIRYDNFVYLRGKAYAGMGDSSRAIADLEKAVAGGKAPLVGKANASLALIAVKAGQVAAQDKTNSGQNAAIEFFRKANTADPASIDASFGLGDAYLWLGDNTASKRENYDAASKVFQNAAVATTDVQAKARAYEGRGRAQLAMSALPGAADAAALLREGINAYTEAAKLAPNNPGSKLSLARALNKAGQFAQASTAYEDSIRLMPAGSQDSSAALMELAELKLKLNAKPEEIRATYERARNANPQSARPSFEIGKSYFDQSLLGDAEREFRRVIGQTGGAGGIPAPGEAQIKADAYYYLSLVGARRSVGGPLPLDAVANADAAVGVGAPVSPRDHTCLAHIVRGGTSVTAEGSSNWCAGNDNKPEGLLLRGMFYLRNAQYVPASAKPISRDAAQFAFNQGLNEAKRAGPTSDLNKITFKWPGSPTPPSVEALLEYGKAVVVACASGLSVPTNLSSGDAQAAEKFFEYYKVLECRPS